MYERIAPALEPGQLLLYFSPLTSLIKQAVTVKTET